jgi:hypothetical protein
VIAGELGREVDGCSFAGAAVELELAAPLIELEAAST